MFQQNRVAPSWIYESMIYHDIYDNLWSNQCKSDSHICSKQSDFAHTGTDECLVPGSSTFLAPPRGSTLVHRDSCLWQENWNYLCDRGTRIIDPRFDRQNMPLLGVAWIWPGPTDWGVGPQFRSLWWNCRSMMRPGGAIRTTPARTLGRTADQSSHFTGESWDENSWQVVLDRKMPWNCRTMDCRLLREVSVSFLFRCARWSHTIQWPSVDSSTDLLTCNLFVVKIFFYHLMFEHASAQLRYRVLLWYTEQLCKLLNMILTCSSLIVLSHISANCTIWIKQRLLSNKWQIYYHIHHIHTHSAGMMCLRIPIASSLAISEEARRSLRLTVLAWLVGTVQAPSSHRSKDWSCKSFDKKSQNYGRNWQPSMILLRMKALLQQVLPVVPQVLLLFQILLQPRRAHIQAFEVYWALPALALANHLVALQKLKDGTGYCKNVLIVLPVTSFWTHLVSVHGGNFELRSSKLKTLLSFSQNIIPVSSMATLLKL